MRRILGVMCLVVVWASAGSWAQGGDEATIRAALTAQVEAWNRGDIPAFMQSYEHSPETTFIGANIGKGFERILERYASRL